MPALAALGLFALALGVARVAGAGLTQPANAVSRTAAQHGGHAVQDEHDPILASLAATLRAHGMAGAQQQLVAMSASDPAVRRREHHYVLAVGQVSFAQTHDVAASIRQCDEAPDTGCYHGVMDAFVANTPRLTREAVARFCDGAPVTAATPALRIQCVHGVGHGLGDAGGPAANALALCDGFAADQDREACYSGVFGKVLERAANQPAPNPFALDPAQQDPFAMCNAVAEPYRRACYRQLPAVMLAANGEDVPAAFATCDLAPPTDVVPCYQGVGSWISIFTYWDPDQTSALCQLAPLPLQPWCLDGAVAGMASGHGTADRPMALCRSAATDLGAFCFEVVGERIPLLYADRPAQERACALAQDSRWIQVCRRSAGLSSPPG